MLNDKVHDILEKKLHLVKRASGNVCWIPWVIWLGWLTERQESHGLLRKL